LIALEGSGQTDIDKANLCLLKESLVAGGQDGIELQGIGARLVSQSSLIVSGGDAVHVDPRPAVGGATNVQMQFLESTVAARRSVLRISDVIVEGYVTDPVRVQSRKSAFMGAFQRTDRSSLLTAEDKALCHGVIQWQGEADALDPHLSSVFLEPGPGIPLADWSRLWGPLGQTRPLPSPLGLPEVRLEGERALDGKPWPLERLQLPQTLRNRVGVNFDLFPGLTRRP
jgi:hypothetical protein